MKNNTKRVATLYRVSTKKQLDIVSGDNNADIPSQRKSCIEFIERQDGWELVKEYKEAGVSGYKVSAANRDVIQDVKRDAENGLFDVLLVFKFDRLGRLDDETPFVLQWFVSKGIEMWSVVEGQQKIEGQMDKLITYLTFWQANTESVNTSIRVSEKHSQMVEEGIFRGGGIPYGYTSVESGNVNKKGKKLLKLVVHDGESEIIKEIFRLVYEEGYGQLRIAKYLNKELQISTRNNKPWSASTINVILKNPIYKGVMRYRGKKESVFSEEISELKIIESDVWEYVQKIRSSKTTNETSDDISVPLNTKGKLLLIGLARCGVCDSRMTSTYFTNKHKLSNGEIKRYNKSAVYRCSGKLQGKNKCDGQSTFSAIKIEKAVRKVVNNVLDKLESIEYTERIEKLKGNKSIKDKDKLKKTQKQIDEIEQELVVLNNEISKSILGKSSFKPEILNNLIETKNEELDNLKSELLKLENESNKVNAEVNKMTKRFENIPVWRDVLNGANTDKIRMALNEVLEVVYISKDNVECVINSHIQELFGE